MNAITIFLILKSLDVIIEFLKKEEVPEKVLHKITERLDRIERMIYKIK